MSLISFQPENLKPKNLLDLGNKLAQYILDFSAVVAAVMIVWAGIKIITSGGNEETVSSAKNTIKWAIIGLVIIIFSKTIVYWLCQIIGAADKCKII